MNNPVAFSGSRRSAVSRATMNDVARKADVGLKTVSRVVNGEAGVSDDTRRRVERAISELGYRRNDSARGLRQGKTNSIGLVCEDLGEPFVSKVIRAIERVAIRHGSLLVVAASGGDADREQEAVEALATRQVDGLIIAPCSPRHDHLSRELDAGLPIVVIDRPSIQLSIDSVLTDNRSGAESAINHLLSNGFRRIAFFGDSDSLFTQVERLAGYRNALIASGNAPDDSLVCTKADDIGHCRDRLANMLLLENSPTAIVTGNSRCTQSVLSAFNSLNVRLALVGFDDFDLAELLVPSITVVEQSPHSIGATAAEILFDRIAGDCSPAKSVLLRTSLITRTSSISSVID